MFVDETGVKTNMTRRYGRAPAGQRVIEYVPASSWNTTTLLAAVGINGPHQSP